MESEPGFLNASSGFRPSTVVLGFILTVFVVVKVSNCGYFPSDCCFGGDFDDDNLVLTSG